MRDAVARDASVLATLYIDMTGVAQDSLQQSTGLFCNGADGLSFSAVVSELDGAALPGTWKVNF